MKRRQFLKASALGAFGLGAGMGGYAWWRAEHPAEGLHVAAALQALEALARRPLTGAGPWSPHQVFTHCAQSIEYSMRGYPQHKPLLFQRVVGRTAFSLFSLEGRMKHGLSEPIPGAPALLPEADFTPALARLHQAFLDFARHQEPLAPHFAYGPLTHAEYERAHVMHLFNHLEELRHQV